MSDEAARRMTTDEFLEWHLRQEQRYEFVDGVPVAMAGARRRHDQVVVNALTLVGGRLRAGDCYPFTADTAIRIPNGNIRYPDLGVDCGQFRDNETWADAPVLVVEVLSESNRVFDFARKLEEYKRVPSLRHIVFVDQDDPEVIHWRRVPGGQWEDETLQGLDAVVSLPDLDLSLPLAVLYARLEFRPQPRLVWPE